MRGRRKTRARHRTRNARLKTQRGGRKSWSVARRAAVLAKPRRGAYGRSRARGARRAGARLHVGEEQVGCASRPRVQGLIADALRRVHGVTVLLEQVAHPRPTKGDGLDHEDDEDPPGDVRNHSGVAAHTAGAQAGPVHRAERTWGRTAG
jgi:hypothetical protein